MPARKTILVVEDNQINRMLLSSILAPTYSVLEAENGQQALDILSEHRDDISLILLDIVMPVMDGYTFLAIIKGDPALSSIPVIVTTQKDGETDEVTALSHGATDFVAKPYRPQIILHRVASIIKLRETASMANQFQHDRLTGLYTKEYFYQRVQEVLLRNPGKKYDIICSDIENFKLINDVFGTPAGDALLLALADLYRQNARHWGICARFHADQFACLLERHWTYTDDMFTQAAKVLSVVPCGKNVSLKWGVFQIDDPTIPVEQMCDRAFLAARSIKGQYGKHFAAYDSHLRSHLLREQAITDCMESALAEGQFVVYLQPKYSVQDFRLAGAEALVRWQHPEWGFLSPGEFIPLFERNGFISRLDLFVWERTCELLERFDQEGLPPLPVSVNVSRADIYSTDLPETLMNLVEAHGLNPARLHLEITESAYTQNPDQIIETMSHLRQLGFIIEMDDFGSGYSALNMLSQLPLDILKLDMRFLQTQQEIDKPVSQGILYFIMDLARWMDLQVVAEGVETSVQMDRLRDAGCDFAQGYYLARPMPAAAFESLARQHHAAHTIPADLIVPPAGGTGPETGPVILLADEDPIALAQARQALTPGFQLVETTTQEQALDALAAHRHRLSAAVVSLTLPGPNDYSVLRLIQRERPDRRIPVLATAAHDPLQEETALEQGVDDFIRKPFTHKALRLRVERVITAAAIQLRESQLRREVYLDALTGLLNRRGLREALETALQEEEAPFAIYLLDLDELQSVNDNYGHLEGDQLLQQLARLLRSITCQVDVVGRYSGDEFLVAIRQATQPEAAQRKGQEFCHLLRDNHVPHPIPCTVGVCLCQPGDNVDTVLARAGLALHHAKSFCRSQCYLWDGPTQ